MRNRGQRQQGPYRESHPPVQDDQPPPPSGDYSYTLEIVMQMQLSMGKLMEAVERLKSDQKDHGKKLDSISHKIYAAIFLLAVIGAILTFFGKSINDTITNRLLAPVVSATATPTPVPSPSPLKTSRN